MAYSQLFFLCLTLHSIVFVILVCLLCTVPDVASSLVPSMTSVAPLAPRPSVTASSMTEPTSVSPSSVASSHLAVPSDQLSVAGESSIHDTSVVTLSRLPPGTGGGAPPGSEAGAIIGAVVAVMFVLVVVSVIVAAVLIAWRVRRMGKEALGKHCD